MRGAKRLVAFGVLLCAAGFASRVWAQQPHIVNAKLETRSAAAGLEKEFRAVLAAQQAPAWIGYAVPQVAGRRHMCCYNSWNDGVPCCGACRLEDHRGTSMTTDDSGRASSGTVKLEGPEFLFVLFRLEQGRVERIQTYSEDCALDAGGLPFYWLTDVREPESITFLSGYARQVDGERSEDKVSQGAVTAIALHRDAAADRALESFVAPSQPERLRERVTFWLGEARGKAGVAVLKRLAKDDPSDRVRDKVTFALSVSKEPEALEEMMRMARSDPSTRVRGQALFWLAQKAGTKAAGAISEAIERDPDTDVKKKAVFALSQLPKDEGVPLLIQVAKTNANPAVRKQAMFWLGQSNDPRALTFFEEILRK